MKAIKILILLILPMSLYSQVDLNKGLVAHYKLDSNVKNDVSNTSNGTVKGSPVFVNDKQNNPKSAYKFNGVNDYVYFPMDSFKSKEYTYSLWANINEYPAMGKCNFIMNVGGSGGDQTISICNNLRSTKLLHGWYGGGYIGSSSSQSRVVTGKLPNKNKWHHLTVVRFDKGVKFYVDCVLIDSIYDNSYPNYGNYFGASIGARNNGTNAFNGKIDEVRIYSRALNNAEVKALCKQDATAIKNKNIKEEVVNLFPNPVVDNLNIVFNRKVTLNKLSILNHLGQVVYVETNLTVSQQEITTKHLSAGIYFVKMEYNDKIIIKKFHK